MWGRHRTRAITPLTPSPFVQAGDSVQTEEQAASYLLQHNIQVMLEDVLSRLLVERPERPLVFLHQELLDAQAHGKRAYFTEDDIRGMHSLHDPTKNNFVTHAQATTALRNLGVNGQVAQGASWTGAHITADEFVTVARQLLDATAQ